MINWNLQPNKEALQETLNTKYGKNFSMNLRNECLEEFKNTLLGFAPKMQKVILVGANDFAEVDLLPDFNFLVGVDLADNAFQNILTKRKNVLPVIANIEELPFPSNYFDEYLAFRALFSSHTSLLKSLSEADRVTKKDGKIIISISNGYLIEGKIIKGMFDYLKEDYDIEKPYLLVEKVKEYFQEKKYPIQVEEVESEIIILISK
jgi:SAM-dependent methyltransferase